MRRRYSRLIIGLVVSLMVAGMAIVSNSAMPGNPLYFVKISFMEPAGSLLALTAAAKTEAAVIRAQSRLSEAENLASHGALTEAANAMLTKAFADSAAQAVQGIDGLARTDAPAGAALFTLFDTSLSAHGLLLKGMPADQAAALSAQIAKARADLGVVGTRTTRAFLAMRAHMEPDVAQRSYALAMADIAAANGSQSGLHAAAGQDMQLSAAQDALAAAKTKLDQQAFGDAFELSVRARAQAQAARVLAARL